MHGAGGWLAETSRACRTRGAGHTRNSCHPWTASLTIPAVLPKDGSTWVTGETYRSGQTFGTSSWRATFSSFSQVTFRSPQAKSTRGTFNPWEATKSYVAWEAVLPRGSRGTRQSGFPREAGSSRVWTLETSSHLSKMFLQNSHANLLNVLVCWSSPRRALDTRQAGDTLFSLHASWSRRSFWSFHSRKTPNSFRPPQAWIARVAHSSLLALQSHISKFTPLSCFTFFTRGTLFTLWTRFTGYTPVTFHSGKSRGARQAIVARVTKRTQFTWYARGSFWSCFSSTARMSPGSWWSNLSWWPLLARFA